MIKTNALTLKPLASMEPQEAIKGFIKRIFEDNNKYVKTSPCETLEKMAIMQTPTATVLTCSDSRIQSMAIDRTPVNELFMVRNIGNQLATCQGSVEYGVRQIQTPILLIVGHVNCGAINAVCSGYSDKSEYIRRELDNIRITPDVSVEEGVIENIHYQVKSALIQFDEEVKNQKLIILGAVYDFTNQYGHGYNCLILVNINGEKSPDSIKLNPYLREIKKIAIGLDSRQEASAV